MLGPTLIFPILIVISIIIGLTTYFSTPDVLSTEEWNRCEVTCQKETGYLPTKAQGPQASCFALIKEHLDSERQRNGKYPSSIDSLLKENYSLCYPLGEEMKIRYIPAENNQDFQLNAFSNSELDSLHRFEKNRANNSEETNQRYSECLKREAQLRWKERRDN